MHVTPWIHPAAHPDTSSLKRLLAHVRFRGLSGEALAIALWHYTVDPEVGFYHYWSPSDLDLARPYMKLDYVKDPLKLINSYGYMLCGTVATVHVNLCEVGGMPARVVGVTGHTVNEVYFDGAWHLFDCDMRGYYRKRDATRALASLRECLKDASLVSDPAEKIEPYGLPDRLPADIAEGCYAPGTGDELPRFIQQFHTMDYVLRPSEKLTRFPYPVERRWQYPPYWLQDGTRKEKDWKSEGPRERFPPHRRWANGCFEYRPDLTSRSRDLELGAWSLENIAAAAEGAALREASKRAGRAVFLLHSPWVITGQVEDGRDPEKKSDAATVELKLALPAGKSGAAALLVSLDGERWEEVARRKDSGVLRADLTKCLERRHRGLVAVHLEGSAVAQGLSIVTWFQLSHNSYPYLSKQGETVFRYHGGDEGGGRSLTEPWEAGLEGGAAAFARTILRPVNLRRDEKPHSRLSPVDPAQPWQAVFRVAPRVLRPRPIVRAWLWASIASVKGDPDAPPPEYRARNPRALLEASTSVDGPWTQIAEAGIPLHKEGCHFSLDGAYQPKGGGGSEIFLRVTSDGPGWEVRGALTCALPEPPAGAVLPPLEIEHRWKEAGQDREHRENIQDSRKPFEYRVCHAGYEIEDTAVIFRVGSTKA